MSIVRSPSLLFPPVSWWQQVIPHSEVIIDCAAPFKKMTWRNRYRIATANGPLLLSVPVMGGRTTKTPISELLIDYQQNWQKQHWRSLFSAYGRAPFFEHYGPSLEQLIHQQPRHLLAFNTAALEWIKKELRLPTVFLSGMDGAPNATGKTMLKDAGRGTDRRIIQYTQVFEDRHGFLPDLSILDLLMNEGPAAKRLLMDS